MSPWENFPIAVGWVKRFLTALAFLSGVHSYFSRVCIRISVTRVFVRICVGQKISSRPFKYFLNEFAFQVKQPRQICSDARSNICWVHFTLRPLGHALEEAPQTPPSSMRGQTQQWWVVSVFLMRGQTLFQQRTGWPPFDACVASSKIFNMFCSVFYNFSTIWWWTVSTGFGSWEVRRCLQFPLYLYFSSSHCICTL